MGGGRRTSKKAGLEGQEWKVWPERSEDLEIKASQVEEGLWRGDGGGRKKKNPKNPAEAHTFALSHSLTLDSRFAYIPFFAWLMRPTTWAHGP